MLILPLMEIVPPQVPPSALMEMPFTLPEKAPDGDSDPLPEPPSRLIPTPVPDTLSVIEGLRLIEAAPSRVTEAFPLPL